MTETEPLILRRWSSVIRTQDRAAYAAYVERTGGLDYAATTGNRGFQMLMRDRGDGSTEVVTLSWWSSMDAVRSFAGDAPELARYYPEDDRYLLEKSEFVDHYTVVAGTLPPA
ncbi:hypothetical protein ACFSQQ_30835 [Mesorhizobium kowhaii]|uniref:ABM domain-containing protein n=1 Tax=Mesorhizobium kowhaii TaxID=1300272 RepID=A0A2W7E6C5_9HYPH|nr:hypothetical protein [Mesorhizobium kowhaii]PZV38756.1 hypothetical protein B5V02_10310 [Mesorhizobium kowhaii]